MDDSPRMLTRDQLRRIYDRVGTWQDAQSFYEAPAVDAMVRHGDFAEARSVLEIGCGTGTLARRLLSAHLPPEATYRAEELSPVMAGFARRRLAPWEDRAAVAITGGAPPLHAEAESADRVVAAYVFDLMSTEDVRAVLREARRVLRPGGLLCCCGLAPGTGPMDMLVERLWSAVHALMPALVGGCRPLAVEPMLGDAWTVRHHEHVAPWGVPSEVLIAEPTR